MFPCRVKIYCLTGKHEKCHCIFLFNTLSKIDSFQERIVHCWKKPDVLAFIFREANIKLLLLNNGSRYSKKTKTWTIKFQYPQAYKKTKWIMWQFSWKCSLGTVARTALRVIVGQRVLERLVLSNKHASYGVQGKAAIYWKAGKCI